MSTLSELLPSGGAGKVMDFVASGTLPNGKPVVLKSDGTVEVVAEGTPVTASLGTAAVFESASCNPMQNHWPVPVTGSYNPSQGQARISPPCRQLCKRSICAAHDGFPLRTGCLWIFAE